MHPACAPGRSGQAGCPGAEVAVPLRPAARQETRGAPAGLCSARAGFPFLSMGFPCSKQQGEEKQRLGATSWEEPEPAAAAQGLVGPVVSLHREAGQGLLCSPRAWPLSQPPPALLAGWRPAGMGCSRRASSSVPTNSLCPAASHPRPYILQSYYPNAQLSPARFQVLPCWKGARGTLKEPS